MTSLLTIRPAVAADRAAIGRLGALIVEEHHQFDSRRFIAPIADLAQRYGTFLITQSERAEMTVLVAEREGQVVGYAFSGMEGNDYMALRGPAGVLHDLIVDPEHRGRDVGRLLLNATLAFFRSRGVPRVVLSTAEQNEAAQRLFASMGFRRTMIEMTRELDDPAS